MKQKILSNGILLLKMLIILIFILTLLSFIFSGFNLNRTYLCGFKTAVIVSESMEPEIKVGDMVLIKYTSYDNVEIGDIIAYEHELNGKNIIIVHRIQEKTNEGIITKGDNNTSVDNWIVTDKDLVGKVLFHN